MGFAKINLLNIRAIALFLSFQFSKDLAIETENFWENEGDKNAYISACWNVSIFGGKFSKKLGSSLVREAALEIVG